MIKLNLIILGILALFARPLHAEDETECILSYFEFMTKTDTDLKPKIIDEEPFEIWNAAQFKSDPGSRENFERSKRALNSLHSYDFNFVATATFSGSDGRQFTLHGRVSQAGYGKLPPPNQDKSAFFYVISTPDGEKRIFLGSGPGMCGLISVHPSYSPKPYPLTLFRDAPISQLAHEAGVPALSHTTSIEGLLSILKSKKFTTITSADKSSLSNSGKQQLFGRRGIYFALERNQDADHSEFVVWNSRREYLGSSFTPDLSPLSGFQVRFIMKTSLLDRKDYYLNAGFPYGSHDGRSMSPAYNREALVKYLYRFGHDDGSREPLKMSEAVYWADVPMKFIDHIQVPIGSKAIVLQALAAQNISPPRDRNFSELIRETH